MPADPQQLHVNKYHDRKKSSEPLRLRIRYRDRQGPVHKNTLDTHEIYVFFSKFIPQARGTRLLGREAAAAVTLRRPPRAPARTTTVQYFIS
ncbi:hypothetical protein EVAR_68057_1 [Eumeta japonica]|uniref:Uncharacterized protein n=1 Tax=Eumeta variegata TaxID=151549 RepID=A0A4C1ZSQ7_EUMVA|nr:hypothetical protein EVAR_68057_1 [Eumeta japonica]